MTDNFRALTIDLIMKWEQFASEMQTATEEQESEYHKGIAVGFEAAAQELKALLTQVYQEPMSQLEETVAEVSLEVTPGEVVNEPKWEYFYITFDQAADGVWRVKHLNGVWQPNWQEGTTFDEAVKQLSKIGWKLARVVNGIHVFKRPIQS